MSNRSLGGDMNKTEMIREYLLSHPPLEGEEGYYARIAEEFDSTPEYVRLVAKRFGSRNVRFNMQAKRVEETPEQAVRRLLKKRKEVSIEWLSDHLDMAVGKVRSVVEALKAQGFNAHITGVNVAVSQDIPKKEATKITIEPKGKWIRFGATGDNHLGSKYERLDVLNALYDLYEREGITVVYNTGNLLEGEARFNKFDIHVYGMEAQVDWFVKMYPKRKGITTYFVTGDDHEGWYVQREGINIGQFIEMKAKEAGRHDLVWLGHMEHDVKIEAPKGATCLRVQHPGGGTAYAISYTAQKIVESYQGGEKPHILLLGHYHKAEWGFPREVQVVQTATTCDQTPFMRKKKIQAHVGGFICEFTQRPDGSVERFRSEFIPFFDKGYYDSGWKYR